MPCNVLVIGYGAVGIVTTYALQKTGKVNVTAVARSNYQTVCDGRMVLKSKKYGDIRDFQPFRVVRTVTEAVDQAYDYVVVATKAIPELYSTSEMVAPLLSSDYKYPQPTYVLMQNGLGVERDLHAALQEKKGTRSARIITGAVVIMSNVIGDTVVHGDFSRFFGGFYQDEKGCPSISSADEETLHLLMDLLEEGGWEAKADPNAQAVKFQKNVFNASLSMLSCLTRVPFHAFFNDQLASQSVAHMLQTIVTELNAVGRALGHPPAYLRDPAEFVEHHQRQRHFEGTTGHKSSALLDVEAGRPFELEVILGEVVRLGRVSNVPVPTLEMMYHILNIMQRQFVLAAVKK
ncbi:hypothetical protein M407DRAFT_18263 [Tulasnella calospora MUT 4182]|uniref:Ketopantoate reductase n=1 Tax=Tulasnella calospora MUT 4182 TaxID=1051891 RepID=A0A0C3LFU3_9AGAM|nr:hypothetical protein M407DRAFT_18263 [Tulasnella calospora MUT 4182]